MSSNRSPRLSQSAPPPNDAHHPDNGGAASTETSTSTSSASTSTPCSSQLPSGSASQLHHDFAQEWVAAFNSGDIVRIAKLYHPDVHVTTPKLIAVGVSPTGTLHGKDDMIKYFTLAMSKVKIHFKLIAVLDGIENRFTILYQNQSNQLVCDVMRLDATTHTIIEYSAYYTQPQFNTSGVLHHPHHQHHPHHPSPPSQQDIDTYWMKQAAHYAEQCINSKNAFNVGAILVDMSTIKPSDGRFPSHESRYGRLITTGFSRELERNTHAEQVCLSKYVHYCSNNNPSDPEHVPPTCVLYSTMEPCSARLSSNVTCVEHIKRRGVKRVVIGVLEPEIFIQECQGAELLRAAGVTVDVLIGLERLCLEPNRHVLGLEWQSWLHPSKSWDGTLPVSRALHPETLSVPHVNVAEMVDVARPTNEQIRLHEQQQQQQQQQQHSHAHEHGHGHTPCSAHLHATQQLASNDAHLSTSSSPSTSSHVSSSIKPS